MKKNTKMDTNTHEKREHDLAEKEIEKKRGVNQVVPFEYTITVSCKTNTEIHCAEQGRTEGSYIKLSYGR